MTKFLYPILDGNDQEMACVRTYKDVCIGVDGMARGCLDLNICEIFGILLPLFEGFWICWGIHVWKEK